MKKILIVLGVVAVALLAWYLFFGGGLERFRQKGADVVIAPQPVKVNTEEVLDILKKNSLENKTSDKVDVDNVLEEFQKKSSQETPKDESQKVNVEDVLKGLQKSGPASK